MVTPSVRGPAAPLRHPPLPLPRPAPHHRDGAPDPSEQTYEDYDEEESRSQAPQAFPPFKAALLRTEPVQEQPEAAIPGDLLQSERAKSELGLMN